MDGSHNVASWYWITVCVLVRIWMPRMHEQSMNHIFLQKNTSASITSCLTILGSETVTLKFQHTQSLVSKALQWNPSKPDTVGPNDFVHYSEMSLMEGLCLFLSQVINIYSCIV